MVNSYKFTKTIVLGNEFLKNTGNRYRFVNQRPYHSKHEGIPDGVNLTLMIIKDDTDYGCTDDGRPREGNLYENFTCTVLNGKTEVDLKKGDYVSLEGFREDISYALDNGFNLLMRFDGYRKLETQNNNGKN